MERYLTINKGKKKIRSKRWCFEAMCLLDDGRVKGNFYEGAISAVMYLFADNEDAVAGCGAKKIVGMIHTLLEWFRSDISTFSGGNGNGENHSLREIYRMLFSAWGVLPDAVERQDPKLLFTAISGAEEKPEIPDSVKALYGI